MQGSLLVDSSFYISRLRQGTDPLEELAAISEEWEIVTCGVVMVEVCRGFKSEKARERFARAFSTMIMVPTPPRMWHKVMDLAWRMERQGRTMQVTDLTIATCALEIDATLLTLDSDFLRVPGLVVTSELPS